MNWLGLNGKCVVITGGSGGIGKACMRAFHTAGATVVALDKSEEAVGKVAKELDPHSVTAIGIGCDITDSKNVARAASEVAEIFGGADILVNNAGILRPAALSDVTFSDWEALLSVNLSSSLRVAQAFLGQMEAKARGSIVQIASIAGSQPQPLSGSYSVSKSAVLMLVRQMAQEWGHRGIRVNSVSPGLVMTPLSSAFYEDPKVREARESMVPLGRIGKPEDMANAALFLGSDRSSYISGQDIVVDGGLSQGLMGLVPRPGYDDSK